MDRERREAEALEANKAVEQEIVGDGLAANAKGLEALAKLKEDMPNED